MEACIVAHLKMIWSMELDSIVGLMEKYLHIALFTDLVYKNQK